jgi:hypothetical protein
LANNIFNGLRAKKILQCNIFLLGSRKIFIGSGHPLPGILQYCFLYEIKDYKMMNAGPTFSLPQREQHTVRPARKYK